MNRLFSITLLFASITSFCALASPRERVNIDRDWKFAFGDASSPVKDFGAGTEYFNYLTKAASIHNTGPYAMNFNDSAWVSVNLPHDFVVDLPFDSLASHSHGYKTVGYRYPETSVGWYRRAIDIPAADSTMNIAVTFDGIFRDSRVWFNGFYLGNEPSGYTSRTYDITPYVNFGGENILTVRADATLEEGWFYEGGGIYRHAWIEKTPKVAIDRNSIFIYPQFDLLDSDGILPVNISADVVNKSLKPSPGIYLSTALINAAGDTVATGRLNDTLLTRPATAQNCTVTAHLLNPSLWSPDSPALYTVNIDLLTEHGDSLLDQVSVKTGFRDVKFSPDSGITINGNPLKLHGVNMHQDHAGVGAGIPDELNVYRLKQLKKYGVNAYRASHNPMTPEVLDACDSLGILVIEEARLIGINDEHIRQLRSMVYRDRNHPSIIMWSIGNEEWGIEWNDHGTRIAADVVPIVNNFDPTRPVTVASSSGPTILIPAQIAGYNYIMQHPVDEHRRNYPQRIAYGSEETSGCGSRGIYFDDPADPGHMQSLNRIPDEKDGYVNRIERGWKFYDERPWLAGLFYWTGFDYRGEPNPLKFPATGSQFGILDYCGFPKDEAFYIKSWWTDEPTLHILPHWTLDGHEGETIPVWVYSNCDEVELIVNGKNLGRKTMPRNGHLEWEATYAPGRIVAHGYSNGTRVMTSTATTARKPKDIKTEIVTPVNGSDFHVVNVSIVDNRGNFVPTACNDITITLGNGGTVIGAGNGDPAFRGIERPAPGTPADTFTIPAFNGHAQFLITGDPTKMHLTLNK